MKSESGSEFVKVGFNHARRMALWPLFQELGPSGEPEAYSISDLFWGEFSHPASMRSRSDREPARDKAMIDVIQRVLGLDRATAQKKYEVLRCRYLYMLPPDKQPDDIFDAWYQLLRKERYCNIERPNWCLPNLANSKPIEGSKEFVTALKQLDQLLESDEDCIESSFDLARKLEDEFRKLYDCWLKSNNIGKQQQVLLEIGADFFRLVYQDTTGACPTFVRLSEELDQGFGPSFWKIILEEVVHEDLRSFGEWMHGVAQLYCFLRNSEYIEDNTLSVVLVKLRQVEIPYIEFLRERFSNGVEYRAVP